MRKALSLLVAATFTATAGAGFTEAPKTEPSKLNPLVLAADVYNEMNSATQLFTYMKVDLPDEDIKFIDSILPKVQGLKIPKVRVEGQQLFFDGLKKPITVIDAGKRMYSYNGQKLDLSMKDGLEATIDRIKPILNDETASLWDFIIPRAHANFDENTLLTTVGGAVGFGGLALGGSCLMGGGGGNCTTPFVMSGIGFLGMFTGMQRAKDKREKKRRAKMRKVVCTNKGEMTVYDGNDKILYIRRSPASQAPDVLAPPAPGQMPGAPAAAGRFVGICDSAPRVASLNAGLSAPAILPARYMPGVQQGPTIPSSGYREE